MRFIAGPLAFLLSVPVTFAAERLTAPVDRRDLRLSGQQVHGYTLELKAGDALFGQIVQRGIDVVVSVRDPGGKPALEIDSPNGTDGPEPLAFVAVVSGRHAVEVRALDTAAAAGAYDLKIDAVGPASAGQRRQAEGLALYTRAMTARNEALRLQGAGEHEPSIRLYRDAGRDASRALELRQKALGADAPDVASTHMLLGLIDDEIGDYVSGKAHFARAVQILERQGGDARAVLTARSDLGFLAMANGEWSEAIALFERTAQERERLFGTGDLTVANALTHLGEALTRAGQHDRAHEVLRRALALAEAAQAPDRRLANLWADLGEVAAARGRPEEATELCGRVMKLAEAHPQARIRLAFAHECLGAARRAARDFDAALAHLREGLRLREAGYGPEHPMVGEALARLGTTLAEAGLSGESLETLRRAERIQARRLRPGHPLLGATRQALQGLRRKPAAHS